MGNTLNVHQMKCIRKIPVSEGGTDKHTNIAFISEEIWRAVMTEDISETIRIMKKFNMDDKRTINDTQNYNIITTLTCGQSGGRMCMCTSCYERRHT